VRDIGEVDLQALTGPAQLEFSHASFQAAFANGNPNGAADQIGIIEFHPGTFFAVIKQNPETGKLASLFDLSGFFKRVHGLSGNVHEVGIKG